MALSQKLDVVCLCGPSLHVAIFWFLSTESTGGTYPPHWELFTDKQILSALLNEVESRLRFGAEACTNLLPFLEDTG